MNIDPERIKDLIRNPSESLSVELKRWINPDDFDGAAKIVKTVLALRNFGGGYMVIGFLNDTLQPDTENVPENVQIKFHIDIIQGLISRFASEPFEIAVEFPDRDGQLYPVIIVPPGVRTPVAAKSKFHESPKKLIEVDCVYIRSLNSNNTPSTTRATWKDWPQILEICFDNREADIGRFLRRHLAGLTPAVIKDFAQHVVGAIVPEVTTEELLRGFLREGEQRYEYLVQERQVVLPPHGAWEVGLIVQGNVPPANADTKFLSLLDSSNPSYTGWPVWLISRGFRDEQARPYVLDGAWEEFIVTPEGSPDHIDFIRLDPKGKFYLRRGLQDDISGSQRAPEPLKVLDFGLPVIRVAEALAVGMAFAKAMGCDHEDTTLSFTFKWSKLRGRRLTSWAQPERYISSGRSAHQDEVFSLVNLPLDTPLSALHEFVYQAVEPLFQIFDGFQLGIGIVEDLTQRLVERRL